MLLESVILHSWAGLYTVDVHSCMQKVEGWRANRYYQNNNEGDTITKAVRNNNNDSKLIISVEVETWLVTSIMQILQHAIYFFSYVAVLS